MDIQTLILAQKLKAQSLGLSLYTERDHWQPWKNKLLPLCFRAEKGMWGQEMKAVFCKKLMEAKRNESVSEQTIYGMALTSEGWLP